MTFDVKAESENETMTGMFFKGMISALSRDAQSVTVDNTRTILTYTTTDGRTMRIEPGCRCAVDH